MAKLEHYWVKRDHNASVMPAKPGIHLPETKMDSRQSLRDFGNDAISICFGNALSLIALGVVLTAVGSAQAATLPTAGYAAWVQQLEQEAIASGITPETAHAALDSAMPDDRVLALDQKQPETTVTFDHYAHSIVSPVRIQAGRRQMAAHEDELDAIAKRYGVPPQIIVALWGMESSFGHDSGRFSIIDSLLTLAYEGRRAEFFRKELIEALRILDQEHISASALRGSWAGAMGQCQFMPSTYLRYAVDYDRDGHRDIWTNTRDVWASIANYLAAEGWNADLTWGREVELEAGIDAAEIGLEYKHSLAEWAKAGVHSIDGSALPNKSLQASLIQPDGVDGRSFLVYDNYRALMRWNRSTYFATAVGLLADRIK
jgi:membrane-bound lytic murein transglycosylase B